MRSALDLVRLLLPDHMDLAVDATVGRGRDTLELAKRAKRIIGFDLQKEALDEARKLLNDYPQVELHQLCHSRMKEVIHDEVDLIMFNLGYLPKGDKSFTTHEDTTKIAILAGLDLLKAGGKILLVAYQHEEGRREIEMLESLALPQQEVDVFRFQHHNGAQHPPEAWVFVKK